MAAAPLPFSLHGYVRGDMFAGKVNGVRAGELKSGYGELSLIARTPKETYGDAFAEARVRYGLQGDGTQATVLDVREAYVNAYAGPLSLRLGQQIVVWGRADALNPTSNLTPVDFRIRSPLEDDLRAGQRRRARLPEAVPAPAGRRLDADVPADAAAGRQSAPVRVATGRPSTRLWICATAPRRSACTWSWPPSSCRSLTCTGTRCCRG